MQKKYSYFLLSALLFFFSVPVKSTTSFAVLNPNPKLKTRNFKLETPNRTPRTIITTDGEIDDVDSFIRMLLYSNEYRVEGLVYSSSMWHYKGDGKGTKMTSAMEMTKQLYGEKTDLRWAGEQWMQELIAAYEKVYPNLRQHSKNYPTASYLRSIVKVGNIDFEGEMDYDTEGSNLIKKKLLDEDSSPLYLQAWGGTNTIARALKSIENQYKNTKNWQTIYKKVCKKAIVYAILDQDATYKNYVAEHWKDLKIYYNSKQFWCLAYFWKTAVAEPLHPFLEGKFMGDNIINNHGALTKLYYSYGDGQKQVGDPEHVHGDITKIEHGQWGSFKQYDFISEGDSPAFLHLVDVGLNNLEHPEYGGWGGRLVQSKTNPNRWEDGETVTDFNPMTQKDDAAYPQVRWLEALQKDFASRADWCINDYKHANHPPTIALKQGHLFTAKPNQLLQLNANATDSDGNQLSYRWWQYYETGSYKGGINIENENTKHAFFKMPSDIKKGETIHVILEVTDNGVPQLTRYQRVVCRGK